MEFDIDGEKKPSKPPPPFVEMLHNKQYVFFLFADLKKKFVHKVSKLEKVFLFLNTVKTTLM